MHYTLVLNSADRVGGSVKDASYAIKHPGTQLKGLYELKVVETSNILLNVAKTIFIRILGFRAPFSYDSSTGTETSVFGVFHPQVAFVDSNTLANLIVHYATEREGTVVKDPNLQQTIRIQLVDASGTVIDDNVSAYSIVLALEPVD